MKTFFSYLLGVAIAIAIFVMFVWFNFVPFDRPEPSDEFDRFGVPPHAAR